MQIADVINCFLYFREIMFTLEVVMNICLSPLLVESDREKIRRWFKKHRILAYLVMIISILGFGRLMYHCISE